MAVLNSTIENIVTGDDCDVIRQIENVPIGTTLIEAWLTIREDYWLTPVILAKHITPVLSTDGRIEDTGADDTIGVLRFRLTKEETVLLHEHFEYDFDVQVKTSDGSIYTPESGKFTAHHSVTSST
jgi:hypothetical protein